MFLAFLMPKITEWYKNEAKDTWEKQSEKIRQMMFLDIKKSIILDREKIKKNPFLEPFSFEDLVNSASKTIWIGTTALKRMCAEALFEELDPRDYRYGNWELFLESIKMDNFKKSSQIIERFNYDGGWDNLVWLCKPKTSGYVVERLKVLNENENRNIAQN